MSQKDKIFGMFSDYWINVIPMDYTTEKVVGVARKAGITITMVTSDSYIPINAHSVIMVNCEMLN